MDNENGREHDHPQAQQQTTHAPPGAPAPSVRPATAPSSGPVPPSIVTSPSVVGSQAPPPLPTTASPVATVPPAQQAPVSPTLAPPQASVPPRPITSYYPGPSQSRFTEIEGDSQSNPDHVRRENGYGRDEHRVPLPPLPIPLPTAAEIRAPPRTKTVDSYLAAAGKTRSEVDHVVPVVEYEKPHQRSSIWNRLDPTITKASTERNKFAWKAKSTGWALNAAIGLQVLLGSLTTGLSAATTSGRQAALATTILGGLSTLVAGYLARARGSNEPELSVSRVKDLDQFVRKCEAFRLDFGHVTSTEHDEYLYSLRQEFEELLGNASGERKLSPPV